MLRIRCRLAAALLFGAGSLGLLAQAQDAQVEPGITAIEALVRLRGAIGAAVEAADLQELRAWMALTERGLPGKSVLWLWPKERLLLAFWLREYPLALALLEPEPEPSGPRRYLPPHDPLFRRLQAASAARREELKQSVRASGLAEDQRYFLLLVLDYLLKVGPLSAEEQLSLNQAAAYFSRRFPRSRHRDYVNREIVAPVLRPSPWAAGADVGAAGVVWLGEWGRNLDPGYGTTGGIDVSFRRLVVYLRAQMTDSTARREFSAGGTWPSGVAAGVLAWDLSAGYLVVASRRLKLAPFIGGGWVSMDPVAGEVPLAGPSPSLRFPATTAGLDLDFLLGSRRFGQSPSVPRTSLVLRTRAAVGGAKQIDGGDFVATSVSLCLTLQVFVRPQRQ